MSTAAAKRARRTLRGVVALLLILASGLLPVGAAKAADLAFPILFIPVYSQDENIFGTFTDTRITVFNPSRHCPVALDPGCVGLAAALPAGTELEMFWFDNDEDLLVINSRPLTPFDVEVITGPTIPTGTGTAIFANILTGISVPILAFFHPLAAVVEIGIKPAPGPILDPAGGLQALTASEAQFIPALAGEFPRIELTAGVNGAPLPFPAGWETVIAETCLLSGLLQNFVVNDAEVFLFDIIVPCTGLDDSGPDLVLFTLDDGGLLGEAISPAPLGILKEGYNRLAIDVNTTGGPLGGPFAGATLFHGQAFVIAPGAGIVRQAYSYNMPANYFFPFTALQRPAQTGSAAAVTSLLTDTINVVVGTLVCDKVLIHLGGNVQSETSEGPIPCDVEFAAPVSVE